MSEDKAYKDGDIVWVKLGNNWWPGEVIDAHRHPDGLVTNIKRKLYCIVKFFNENAYEYVSNVKQIYQFQCQKKAEFIKKGLSLYKSGNKFMEKFPEDVEVAERLTRHQVPSVFINDRPDSIVKAILGQPLVLNSDEEYYGSSDYREKRKSSESITKIINITPSKPAPPTQQMGVENVVYSAAMNSTNIAKNINFRNNNISSRTSFGGELSSRNNTSSTTTTINNNNYQCNICDFTSVRQNVMILHRKMHSSRNGSTAITNQNTSLNRSNTKVNIPAPATMAVKTSSAAMAAINISTAASPINTPAIVISSSKTNDQSTANSSSNDSSIIVVTDTSTSSDVEVSATDSQGPKIRRSMRGTTKTATVSDAEATHGDVINGSTVSIDLPEIKPIKKIPKKRDFVNLNLLQDDEINSPIVLDLQANTTDTTEEASSSRPSTPVAKVHAEEIRKMLLEDWSDDDETPDHDNKVASENRERIGSNNNMDLLPLGPGLTSTPCSEYKSTNASTRIRNIPKKDRRDVILQDFSAELLLNKTVEEPEVGQRDVVPIEESSNSSAVELIEDHQPAVITINDEEEEVAKTSIITSRRSHFENVESNDKSIVASILSCFDFQASDDEDDNDIIAAAGSRTPSTTHFKKKYLSSEKSLTYLKDVNNGKSTTTQPQKQNEEMAEKDQQLTAEIENLLAITQPPPTDLLTSTNSIEECLSVKDLPIKERGKRIFKSRNRSRIEDKSTNSISTDDSFTKDSISPNILDIKQSNDHKKTLAQRQSFTGEAESIHEKSLGDTTKDSIHIRRQGNIEIVTPKEPATSENKDIVNNSPDNINVERPHDLGAVRLTCDESSDVAKNELIATTKETTSECLHVIPNKSSDELVREIPQPLISNELPTLSNAEILTEVPESFRKSQTINDVRESIRKILSQPDEPNERENKNEDIQSIETSGIEEIFTVEQEIVPLDVVQDHEDVVCGVDIDKSSIPLTEESVKCAPSVETDPLPENKKNLETDTLINTIEKDLNVEQITNETTNICNTFDNVEQNIINVITNQDHDDKNNKNLVDYETSNEKITVAIDVAANEQLIMASQKINDANVAAPTKKPESRSRKVDDDTTSRQKQPDSSVTEEFTSNRLITTTPPTDENSSMCASDTGAEFGSPTSMLSEERLPTFLFSRNDTPQRDVETTTDNQVNKKINQTPDDNVKGPDQRLDNNIHTEDAVSESKNNLKNDTRVSNSSNGNVNSDMRTNPETTNDNSTTLSMTENPTSIELKATESNELFSKHVRSKLSPDSAETEQRKSPTESHQRRNRHKRHLTRRGESKVPIQSVENVGLSLEATTIATDDNILNFSESQEEMMKNNLNQSGDSVTIQPKAVTAANKTIVTADTKNVKKPENNSTNQETQQESAENDSMHVNEEVKNSLEGGKVDQKIKLDETDGICSPTHKESQLSVKPSTNKQTENTLHVIANENNVSKNLDAEEKEINDDTFTVNNLHRNANKMDRDITMIQKINSEGSVPRSPKKRVGDTLLLAASKHRRHDLYPEQTEILPTIDQGEIYADESNMNENTTKESETKLTSAESSDANPHVSKCSKDVTEETQTAESKISASLIPVATADTKLDIMPTNPKQEDLKIDCKSIVAVQSRPSTPDDKDVGIDIENHTMAAEEIIVEYESIPQTNNIIEYDSETGATMNYVTINAAESKLTSVPDPCSAAIIAEKNEQPKCVENDTLTNISQSITATGEQESYAADKSTEDFLIEFDSFVNQTTETTATKAEHVANPNATEDVNNAKYQIAKENITEPTSKIPEATNSRQDTESQRDQSLLFSQRAAIKRRKTICFELAEFGLRVGESTRKRQVIDFEDTLPEGSTNNRRTNERKMTMPDTFDYNSQFKSFKPRRRSSIEDNMKSFSRNWAHIDEELIEANSNVSSELAAKQIGIDSKGNKYVVIKDVTSLQQGSGSTSSIRKQRSDSSDSSLLTQRNGRTMKRKSSQSKATTSKSNTKASAAILNRRLSLPSENFFRVFGTSVGCVAIKPKITRDQVISSLNDNQLSTAQQQLMQLQQQQQQQQQVQSPSIILNKQQSSRTRKTHRTQQQSSNQMVQQVQLQAQLQQQQLQQQLITQLSNQQNILQFVTPQVQQQVQPANEGFIIATAATTEDDNVIDSNTQLIALPTQPYPGYTETFLLCKVNGNTCKPVDNVPLYLNHQLNELVPIPLDVLEGTPQMATDNDGTVEIKQGNNSQQLVEEDKTTEHITIGEAVLADVEISDQGNAVHEQYLHDNVEAPVNEEEVTADLSSNNGILLNIEGQQVLLDAATFEHLLANPDANTQLISDDGTEYVLTHEVLQALHMQQQQEQQQQQIMSITNATGTNNDIIAVAMAGSDLYGNGVLTIDTTQAMQLLEGNGSMVFQQPTTAMVQQHLTPPAIVTNAVLDQSPIMSTLEVPSGSRMQIPHCITVPSMPIVAPSSVILGSGGTHPNLDDSLAAIGVTAQTSAASSVLGLPITVTDPNIASKVTSAGPLNEMLQFVTHRPATAAATAAAVAAAALAGESRIFKD